MIENGVNMMQDIPVRVLPQAEMLRHSEPGLPPPDVSHARLAPAAAAATATTRNYTHDSCPDVVLVALHAPCLVVCVCVLCCWCVQVQCVLPSAAAVASVVERMKTFSKVLFLTGDMGNSSSNAGSGSGGVTLCLSVAQDMVDVRTHFRDLRGAPEGMADARDSGADSALSDLGRQSVRKGRGSGKASAAVDALVFHRVLRSITALPSPADTILGIVTGMAVYVHVPLQDGSGNVTYIMSIVDSGMGEPDAEDGDTGGGGGGGGE